MKAEQISGPIVFRGSVLGELNFKGTLHLGDDTAYVTDSHNNIIAKIDSNTNIQVKNGGTWMSAGRLKFQAVDKWTLDLECEGFTLKESADCGRDIFIAERVAVEQLYLAGKIKL